jgi:uncharacterized protein YkwD
MSVRLGAKIASVILAVAAVAAVVITAPRADETAQPAAGSAGAANDGRQAVNKPVITDKMLTEAAKAAPADPLHRHPTLLRMLFRNNTVRNRFGLRSHRVHPALTKAAQDHANYMARTGDFSHYSNLGPSGRASKYGFRYGVMENIAYGYSSIEAAFAAWQASGGHWANMSSNSSVAGFGFAKSSNGTTYWVAMYGTAPASESEAITEAALITTAPTVGGANAAAPAGAGQSTSGPPASGPPARGDTPPASEAEAEADAGNDDSVTTSSGNSGSNRRRLLFRRR